MITAERLLERLGAKRLFSSADIFTDEEGAAYLVHAAPRTLRAWRAAGTGPRATFTSRWLYDLEDLAAWLSAGGNRSAAGSGSERQIPAASGKR